MLFSKCMGGNWRWTHFWKSLFLIFHSRHFLDFLPLNSSKTIKIAVGFDEFFFGEPRRMARWTECSINVQRRREGAHERTATAGLSDGSPEDSALTPLENTTIWCWFNGICMGEWCGQHVTKRHIYIYICIYIYGQLQSKAGLPSSSNTAGKSSIFVGISV